MVAHRFVVMMVCFMALAFFTACPGGGGGGGDAGPVNSASALTADQFAVTPTRSLSFTDFTDRLNDDSDFMWDSQSTSSSDTCLNAKINVFKFTRSGSNTFTLSVNDTDFKDCLQEPDLTVNEATFSIFIDNALAKDAAGNTIDLDNVSFDTPGMNLAQYTMKTRIHLNMTGVQTGRTVDSVDVQVQHASTGFNDPCLSEGADQCRKEEVEQVHRNFSAPTDYIDKDVLESHVLGVVHGAPYFAGGTMTFTFNNWSGTMTYNSSAFTAPTYTATDGVNPVSGTYTHLAPPFKAKGLSSAVGASIRSIVRKAVLADGLR
jgi:hypothetical protein